MSETSEFENAYDGFRDALNLAKDQVFDLIAEAIGQIGNPYLVRGRLTEARVKPLPSVLLKCKRSGLQPDQLLTLTDLVGLRVACSNLEDVSRLVELVRGIPTLAVVRVQRKKTSDGYRAVHVDIRFVLETNGQTTHVPCELQIRTLFQDSWARQTHQDLYKGGRIPAKVKDLSRSLSQLLDTADVIAQQIREEMSQRKPRRGKLPEEVTERGLGLIYQRAFNEPAPEYLLQITRRRCEEERIDRLDALDRLLGDLSNRRRLSNAYNLATSFYDEGDDSNIVFEFAPIALARGMDAAVDAIRKRALAQNAEIEGRYRSELLSELPPSFGAFMKLFICVDKDDDPAEEMARYASALGATESCTSCGARKLSEYDFVGEIQKHYRVSNHDDEILQQLWDCGAGNCSHCGRT